MILLTCPSCKAQLAIDDAFAGGVCRCQYCGAFQTVPEHLKGSAEKAGITQSSSSDEGLDQLAVVSSGAGPHLSSAEAMAAKRKRMRLVIAIVAGSALLFVLLMILISINVSPPAAPTPSPKPVLVASPAPAAPTDQDESPAPATPLPPPPPPKPEGPNFAGIPLDGEVVIYVIDNGGSSSDLFDDLKGICYTSIQSLGPQRRFAIVFWGLGGDTTDYPPNDQPALAMPANIDACRKMVDDVVARGQTDPGDALTRAFAAHPSQIVLITAKGWGLDESLVDKVLVLRGSSSVKVHTVAIGGETDDGPMAHVAAKTGGQFLALTKKDVQRLGD